MLASRSVPPWAVCEVPCDSPLSLSLPFCFGGYGLITLSGSAMIASPVAGAVWKVPLSFFSFPWDWQASSEVCPLCSAAVCEVPAGLPLFARSDWTPALASRSAPPRAVCEILFGPTQESKGALLTEGAYFLFILRPLTLFF